MCGRILGGVIYERPKDCRMWRPTVDFSRVLLACSRTSGDRMTNSEKPQPRACHDCGANSPATDTSYTLISQRFGWRVTKETESDGTLIAIWRCPVCWSEYKRIKSQRSPNGIVDSSSRPPTEANARDIKDQPEHTTKVKAL